MNMRYNLKYPNPLSWVTKGVEIEKATIFYCSKEEIRYKNIGYVLQLLC